MLEVACMGMHVAQMTSPAQMRQCFDLVTVNPARIMHLEDYGLDTGCMASLVVLEAADCIEALRLRANRMTVIAKGKVVARTRTPRRRARAARPAEDGRSAALDQQGALVMAAAGNSNLTVVEHPLVQHKLTLMRDKDTPSAVFRQLLREISLLLGYEVLRDLPLSTKNIETPLAEMEAPILKGKKVVFVSILRAGNGLLDGLIDLVPSARIGHIGLYRDPKTLQPIEYYFKVPTDISERRVILVDPMLATGNSVAAAIKRLKDEGVRDIKLMTLLAAPEGIQRLAQSHPDVHVYTAAVDRHLNDHGYIVPGLGDAGDRMFGTK